MKISVNHLCFFSILVRYGAKWRLPGGRVDLHETIAQAAERELFEECGIQAKFESVLGFRETLQF